MPIITTYHAAKMLRDKLHKHGIKIKKETKDMKTSGIYIPRWEDCPYEIQADGSVKWFFFFRFENDRPDLNVGEAILYLQEHGIHGLVRHINGRK
jgi:hypothetical protein